jgi:hypothetical protein
MIGISGVRRTPAPASSLAIGRAELVRDGDELTVRGLASAVEDVDLEEHPASAPYASSSTTGRWRAGSWPGADRSQGGPETGAAG